MRLISGLEGTKNFSLALAFFSVLLMLTPVFSYSIPLSWVKNKTGASIDADGDGIIDWTEFILRENIGSGLNVSNGKLEVGEGEGVDVGEKTGLNSSYLKTRWYNLTERSKDLETHTGIRTVEPAEGRYSEILIQNNDTYSSVSSIETYNVSPQEVTQTENSPVINDSEVLYETGNESHTLTEGENYTVINYTTGEFNITNWNTTAGWENVSIEYSFMKDTYNFSLKTTYSPLYPNSVEVTETYNDTSLGEGDCKNCYSIDNCTGELEIKGLNTTAGDNETVVIKYNYPPQSLNGDRTDGIIHTDFNPVVKGSVEVNGSQSNLLEKGKCKDYEVLNYQTGKIKLWRYNKTTGLETVNVSYNYTGMPGREVFWNSTSQVVEINESNLSSLAGNYLKESGGNLSGDLDLNGNNLEGVGVIGEIGILRLNSTINMSSKYISDSPSIKGVPTQSLVGYWPMEGTMGDTTGDWSLYGSDAVLPTNTSTNSTTLQLTNNLPVSKSHILNLPSYPSISSVELTISYINNTDVSDGNNTIGVSINGNKIGEFTDPGETNSQTRIFTSVGDHMNLGGKNRITYSNGNVTNITKTELEYHYGLPLVNGRVGKALTFDGNDNLAVAHSDSLNTPNTLTVAHWVTPNSNYTDEPNDWYLFSRKGGTVWEFGYEGWDDEVGFKPRNSTGESFPVKDNINLTKGETYFYVGVINTSDDSVKLYRNGKLVDNRSDFEGEILQSQGTLNFGEDWNGSIDEVRIYNRALNQNEVRTLYEKGRNRRQEIGGAWLPREGGKLYGDLDMNDNKITGFFASNCGPREVAIRVNKTGEYMCKDVNDMLLDFWVNETGDKMNGTLDMNENRILEISRVSINNYHSPYGRIQINQQGNAYYNSSKTHPFALKGGGNGGMFFGSYHGDPDTLVDGDGNVTISGGSIGVNYEKLLVPLEKVSPKIGEIIPGKTGVYYYDVDGDGKYSQGDDIVADPTIESVDIESGGSLEADLDDQDDNDGDGIAGDDEVIYHGGGNYDSVGTGISVNSVGGVADIGGDGDQDVAYINSYGYLHYYDNGSKESVNLSVKAHFAGGFGDIDLDNLPELAYVEGDYPYYLHYYDIESQTSVNISIEVDYPGYVADIDGDGKEQEIVYIDTDEYVQYYDNGSKESVNLSFKADNLGGIADIGNDGDMDIAYRGDGTDDYLHYYDNGSQTSVNLSVEAYFVGDIGDIDGDGSLDISYSDFSNNLKYYDNNSHEVVDTGLQASQVGGVADIGSDRDSDIFYKYSGTGELRYMEGLIEVSNGDELLRFNGTDDLAFADGEIENNGGYDFNSTEGEDIFQDNGDEVYLNREIDTSYIQAANLSLNNLGGNVGIGTTSPKRKLHVAGDVLLDNNKALAWKNSTGGALDLISFNNNLTVNNIHNGLEFWTSELKILNSTEDEQMSFDLEKRVISMDATGYYDTIGARSITDIQELNFKDNQIEIGSGSSSTGTDSIALGTGANASADGSIAIGDSSRANKSYSIALGDDSNASGVGSVIIGPGGSVQSDYTVKLNDNTEFSGYIDAKEINIHPWPDKPFLFKAMVNEGGKINKDTGISSSDWRCSVAGFAADGFELEDSDNSPNYASLYDGGSNWWAKTNVNSKTEANWSVQIFCTYKNWASNRSLS